MKKTAGRSTGFRAAAYARYSTVNQTKLSIERQLYGIDQYCAEEGLTLVGYYMDEAETGTNTEREDFQRLLADAERGVFDTVVIYDMQRGSRDVADWFIFRKEMRRLGVQVISVTNKLGDIDDPNDFLTEGVTAVLGQHQVLQYRRDSIEGQRTRARKGMFCGGIPPLGYDVKRTVIKMGQKEFVESYYIINEREAAVVRMIFDMYAMGRSYSEILAEVRKTGVTGKLGQPIENNTLHYILKNERYTGTFVWGEYEMRHMRKWVGRKNDEEDVIRIQDAIPQIVSCETWEAVRARMQENRKNKLNHDVKQDRYYLLSGLIRCGNCSGPLAGVTTTSKGREYKRYICINKRKEKSCKAKDVRADKLEERVLDILRSRVLVPEFLSALADKIVSGAKQTSAREEIRAEMQSIDRKNANLYAAIENGLSTQETINRINENARRKKELEDKMARMPSVQDIDKSAVKAVLMADVSRSLETPQAQKEVIRRYVQAIAIHDEYIDLVVSPDLSRYTASNKKVFTNPFELVNTTGSPGVNYTVFTNDDRIQSIIDVEHFMFAYRIPRELVA